MLPPPPFVLSLLFTVVRASVATCNTNVVGAKVSCVDIPIGILTTAIFTLITITSCCHRVLRIKYEMN